MVSGKPFIIGHDRPEAGDNRPVFQILYREWSSTRPAYVRVTADDIDHAMQALHSHVGNFRFSVISARVE
jgi:hypothetical protein